MALLANERIEEFITRTANETAKQLKGPQGGETDLSSYIVELARYYGFTADEVRQGIGTWMKEARKDVTDFRKQGMVAFAEKNFRLAGENFRRSAEEKERQAAEQLRESAKDRELSGDSFYNALDFREALKEYQMALKSLNAYHDGLGALGIKVYPEYTADVQHLSLKLANARSELERASPGLTVRRHLTEAVQEYERLIAKNPRSTNPQDWAMTQNNLGIALRNLGERWAGPRGAAAGRGDGGVPPGPHRLHPRRPPPGLGHDPEQPGHRAESLGERLGGAEGARRLDEAAAAYRQALAVCTRDDLPQMGHDPEQPGHAAEPGRASGGAEGARRLDEAAEAYRQALAVCTRDDLPQQWAMTQNNLGTALMSWASVWAGPRGAAAGRGTEAYRQALTVYTRDDLPQQWATTQNNLVHRAKGSLGERLGGAERACGGWRRRRRRSARPSPSAPATTSPAVGHDPVQPGQTLRHPGRAPGRGRRGATAGRGDGGVTARPSPSTPATTSPMDWADPEQPGHRAEDPGRACKAGRGGGTARARPTEAFRQALAVFTRDDLPQQWAMTQNNLGLAFTLLGRRTGPESIRWLGEAVVAFRQALTVFTREPPRGVGRYPGLAGNGPPVSGHHRRFRHVSQTDQPTLGRG